MHSAALHDYLYTTGYSAPRPTSTSTEWREGDVEVLQYFSEDVNL